MAFLLQLKILLWKNLTLKRRTPLVLLFEILIPLTLFVVLVCIRHKQPAIPCKDAHYTAQPLPSAGVLAIMQQFCDHGYRGEDGFAEFTNNSLYSFLDNLQEVAENNNFFDPGFSPDQMSHIPDLYRSIIDDPATLHDIIIQAKDFKLDDVFSNVVSLKHELESNFSLPPADVDAIFSSKINFTEVYRILFGVDKSSHHRYKRSLTNQWKSMLRDLDPRKESHDEETYDTPAERKLIPILSALHRSVDLSSVQNIINKSLPIHIDLDHIQNAAVNASLPDSLAKSAHKVLHSFDSSKMKDIINNIPFQVDPKYTDIFDHLGHGLMYNVIRNDPQLLLDPDVRDVIESLYGFGDASQYPDPKELVDVLKKIIFTSNDLHYLVCNGRHELSYILIPARPEQKQNLISAEMVLCNMSSTQWHHLADVLKQDINSSEVVQKFNLNTLNYTAARLKVEQFKTNVQEFITFQRNMMLLSELASNLPQTECDSATSNFTGDVSGNSTAKLGNETGSSDSDSHHRTKRSTGGQFMGLIQVWIAMQRTVCGQVYITDDDLIKYQQTLNLNDLGISDGEKYRVGILAHALYSNPRVLYVPNDTEVDTVIQKANETFALIDLITKYATKWLNVSGDIKTYLLQNATRHNLDSIRQMQKELRTIPDVITLINNSTIQDFINNKTVPEPEYFLHQLDIVDNAACSWLKLVEGLSLNVFKGFRTEEELVDYFLHDAYADGVTVFASVIFDNLREDGSLPPHVVYRIRQNASFTPTTREVRLRYWHPGHGSGNNYYSAGFVWIQDIIERAIINVQVGHDVMEPGSYIWELPYPCYMQDQFLFMIEHVMPLCLTISWVYTVAMLVQNIVYEKEQRLKEVMRMMGLSSSVHWVAWFITAFTQMTVTMGLLTVLLKYGQVLHYSNSWIIFLELEVFAMATIAFSFLVSVCYSKAKVAAACAGIIYFLTYVPYMYIAIREEAAGDKISAWAKSIASLFSTTAFGLGAKYFAFYEIEAVGVQWSNMNRSPVEDDQYSLFLVMQMMIIDTIIYGMLTWYIENVHPGSYGLPKPWYFPFTTSYWWGHPKTELEQCSLRSCCRQQPLGISVMEEDQACAIATGGDVQQYLEPEPSHLPLGVSIQDLTKVYKTGKLAVNRLSLNFYEGQITSFLGHNGAGKTTTMSILTGLYPPTSGTATIYGNNIRTDMDEIRKSMGMCPQHNVLFEKLTVAEHLWFYARLKGMEASSINEDMEKMIKDIGLPHHKHHTVDCLSGGMQRKLSVAIAFIGGSRTVILDEPTAGVDPYARRAIWDLLVKYKQGRTIILSTHHMDEADILGDRIAIISHGQLKACGSSLFLKNMFGDGYHIMFVKKPSEEDLRSMDTTSTEDMFNSPHTSFITKCTEAEVTMFLRQYVPTVYLQGENPRELHYILPFEEAKKGNFERLFDALDHNLNKIHVSSYGVMDTLLEEVFLKVTDRSQNTAEEENQSNSAKEISMNPAGAVPIPANNSQDNNQRDKDESSLAGGSILLGSINDHDLELGTLTNILPGSLQSSNSGSFSRLSNISHHDELRRRRGHQRSWSGSYTQGRGHELSEVTGVQPFVCRHRRSVSGSSWTPPHITRVQEQEAIATGGPRGHRRAWSGSSWSRLSQYSGPIGTQPQGQGQLAPSSAVEDETQSLLSQDSDVPLLDTAVGKNKWKSHKKEMSTSSDVSHSEAADNIDPDKVSMTTLESFNIHPITGYCLLMQQFWAIIIKRFFYIQRNWRSLFSQILLPALFVCIAMTVALTAPRVEDLPSLLISPAQYYNYTQPTGNYIVYRVKSSDDRHSQSRDLSEPSWLQDADSDSIVRTFHMPAGISATCVLQRAFNSSFDEDILKHMNMTNRDFSLLEEYFEPECASVFTRGIKLKYFLPTSPTLPPTILNSTKMITPATVGPHPSYYPECHCAADNSGLECAKSGYVDPPEFKVITGDHIQDISGQDEEKFYLNTYDKHRINRYGGFSLNKHRTFVPPNFGHGAPSEFRKLAVHSAAQVRYMSKGWHAMPVYINALNNAILRANLPPEKGNPSAYGITAYNHPMNNTNNGLSMAFILQGSDVLIAIFIIFAMSFVPASFVVFLVYERSIKAKHLHIVSGMNRVVYWIANLVWDMCNYLVPAACCIIILRIFDIPAYVSGINFPAVISLFLLYGWSITPMMYPASFLFKEPSTAYISLIVINLFIGITCIITSFLLELFQTNDDELKAIHDVLKMVFLVFPNYCLGRGLMDIAFNEYWNEYFFKTGQYGRMKSPFEWKLMARNLVAMAIMGVVFFIITLLCEFNFFMKKKTSPSHSYTVPQNEDVDVANERKRVLRGHGKRDVLRLENLTQVYVTRKLGHHLAVNRLCLGVPQGECFGLLGVNGAGKTTTFRMLTGDLRPTGGDALLNGYSVLKDTRNVQQAIGYCPQFDSLYDELTGREHIQLYARLRGIPYKDQKKVVDWALKKLCLTQVADNLSVTYSGGNKRKLSCAIALIGNPPIIFLDEPTTGMDPHSRRFLWDLILSLVESGRSVILTSHSMEECEVLCTRLAIMVNGQFKCLGSAQHLKSRFGDGYTVTVRVKGPHEEREVLAIRRFMHRHFAEAVMKECHHNMVQYELPSSGLSLSTLFSKMEEAARSLNVEDYSISQNTLDNVFINFVKQQQELIQESGDSYQNDLPVTTNRMSSHDEMLQNTELQPILTDTDDVLLDLQEEDITSSLRSSQTRLTFLDAEPIQC